MKTRFFMHLFLILIAILLSANLVGCGCNNESDDDDDDAADVNDDVNDDANDDANDDVNDDSDDDMDDDIDDDADDDTGETFRIAVIADAFVSQDDVLHYNDVIDEAIENLNALEDIDFVLILGDMAARFYNSYWDYPWWTEPFDPDKTWDDAVAVAMASLENLNLPYYFAPGEKEYSASSTSGSVVTEWADWAERDAELKTLWGDAYPGSDPWYAFTHKGVKFLAANSMAGPQWQLGYGATGSLGQDQLAALADEISSGDPTIIFSHHSSFTMLDAVAVGDGEQSLEDVLTAKADNVFALLNGHHNSYNEYNFADIDAYGFGSVHRSSDYIAVLEIDPAVPSLTVVNKGELPYPPEWENYSCEPGEDAVGDLSGLEGTFHGVYIQSMTSDNWVLDMLLAAANLDDTPFALWVVEDKGDDLFDIMFTMPSLYRKDNPESGEYSLTKMIFPTPPCEIFEWQADDPCMDAPDASLPFDLMPLIDPWGNHLVCGVHLNYDLSPFPEARLGYDDDGNLTFDIGQISATLEKTEVIDMMKQFIVDSYCAYNCFGNEPNTLMTPVEGCDAEENGHKDACDGDTLTFDDVPLGCDSLIGDATQLPSRLILWLLEAIPDGYDDVTFGFQGWGHELTLVDTQEELTEDWTIWRDVFGWNCPEQPE